jgi:hypothetical protein
MSNSTVFTFSADALTLPIIGVMVRAVTNSSFTGAVLTGFVTSDGVQHEDPTAAAAVAYDTLGSSPVATGVNVYYPTPIDASLPCYLYQIVTTTVSPGNLGPSVSVVCYFTNQDTSGQPTDALWYITDVTTANLVPSGTIVTDYPTNYLVGTYMLDMSWNWTNAVFVSSSQSMSIAPSSTPAPASTGIPWFVYVIVVIVILLLLWIMLKKSRPPSFV